MEFVIVKHPNENLNKVTESIQKKDTETILKLYKMSKYILVEDNHAVGLALPQIGINKRGFVMMIGENVTETVINPIIIKHSNEKTVDEEGCLSVDNQKILVSRYKWIDSVYYDSKFKIKRIHLSEFLARVFQHEFDHLNGITILDK